jgi:RNA polymerase sigma factor (sigma-70 family)
MRLIPCLTNAERDSPSLTREEKAREEDVLLRRFRDDRDHDAFAALVVRHGELVLGVARRIVQDAEEAEDVFQAVFLVLAQKANSIRQPGALRGWLHRTTVRLALDAKKSRLRRRCHEQEAGKRTTRREAAADLGDVQRILDEELARLPDHYRLPLLLCCLEGHSQDEAARLVNWPRGTVAGRLARARALLRQRLTRRGVTLSAALLGAFLSEAPPVSAALAKRATSAALLAAAGLPLGGAVRPLALQLVSRGVAVVPVLRYLLALGLLGGLGLFMSLRTGLPPAPAVPIEQADHGDPGKPPPRELGPRKLRTPERIQSLAWPARGAVMATGAIDGPVRLWDAVTFRERATLPVAPRQVNCVALSPDGALVAAAVVYGKVHVWDATGVRELWTWNQPRESAVPRVLFSPDGKLLAATGDSSVVWLFDARTGKEIRRLRGDRLDFQQVAFSPDGKLLVTATSGLELHVWETATGNRIHTLAIDGQYSASGLAFAPDGTRLYASRYCGPVLVWDAVKWTPLPGLPGDSENLRTLAISFDGRFLAHAGDNRRVRVFELASRKEIACFTGHTEAIWDLAFAPDGRALVSGSWDTTCLVWDLTGRSKDGRLETVALLPEELAASWRDLARADAVKAQQAVWRLVAGGERALLYLEERLTPDREQRTRIKRWLDQLDHRDFAEREKAMLELENLGSLIESTLRSELSGPRSLEARSRIERLLDKIDSGDPGPESLRLHRGVQALEAAGAQRILERLTHAGEGFAVSVEAGHALRRCQSRNAR